MTYKELEIGDFFKTLHDNNALYMKTDQPSQAVCIVGDSIGLTGHIVRMFTITEVKKVDYIKFDRR